MKKILIIVLFILSSVSFAENERKPNSSDNLNSDQSSLSVERARLDSRKLGEEELEKKRHYKQRFDSIRDYSQIFQVEGNHP